MEIWAEEMEMTDERKSWAWRETRMGMVGVFELFED